MQSTWDGVFRRLFLGLMILAGLGWSVNMQPQSNVQAAPGDIPLRIASSSVYSGGTTSHRSVWWSLKSYASGMKGASDWPTCPSGKSASMPWQPATTSFASNNWSTGGSPGAGYNGDSLYQRGDCATRFTDSGNGRGAWVYPSWNNWTRVGSVGGFKNGVSSGTSSVVSCGSLYGGGAQMIFGSGRDMSEQAYTSGGIFAASQPSSTNTGPYGRQRLWSNGTSLIRGEFNITPETLAKITGPQSNDVVFYAVADDWMSVYINGVHLGETGYTRGSLVGYSVARYLRSGDNVIAIQVSDKARWQPNPVADNGAGVCYNITASLKPWSVTPTAQITSPASSNQINDVITWNHRVSNNSEIASDSTLNMSAQNRNGLGTGTVNSWSRSQPLSPGDSFSNTSTHRITSDDVGKNLCRLTSVRPYTAGSSGASNSATACLYIPYNYVLTPSITASLPPVVSQGESVEVPAQVSNVGPTKSRPSQWQLTKTIVLQGNPIPNGGASSSNPCQFYGGGSDCSRLQSGSNREFNPGMAQTALQNYVIPATIPDGARICFGLSVQPRAIGRTASGGEALDNRWEHSNLVCTKLGKKPKAQIHGGSLNVGRGAPGTTDFNHTATVQSTTSRFQSRVYGSWVEYGILAPGSIVGVASDSGLSGGFNHPSDSQSNWSNLSFTMPAASGGGYGGYTVQRRQRPDVAAAHPITSTTPRVGANVTLGDLVGPGAGRVVTSNQNTIRISAGELTKGQWAVLNVPNAHVIITGNLTYTEGNLENAKDIPQLKIVARYITIANNVMRVDSWLVASNSISTCDQRGNAADLWNNYRATQHTLSRDDCTLELKINGPVMTNRLFMRRTAGSLPPVDMDRPAETFNLRPDAAMHAYSLGASKHVYRTTSVRELPPRY